MRRDGIVSFTFGANISAVNDALFPLLGIGPKLFPDAELKQAADQINHALWTAFTPWTTAEWLEKHTNVSAEEFAPNRGGNRFTVVVNRSTPMADRSVHGLMYTP